MNTKNFIEGLLIMQKYYSRDDGYTVCSNHDEIFLQAADKPMSEEDIAKMFELGFCQPHKDEGDPYDPEEFWLAYV